MTLEIQKEQHMVRYEGLHGEVALSVNYVQAYFCPKANKAEAFAFMKICQRHRLDPFLREVYIVKYSDNEPAQFIIGYQSWTQRAEKDPNYQGFKAGLILSNEKGMERREGTFYGQGETVEGGWCEITLAHRPEPVRIEVALHEYVQKTSQGQPNKMWREKPGTMIRKVAIAQAHREAFPSLFAGLYDQSEIGPDRELSDDAIIIEGISTPVEDDPETVTRKAPTRRSEYQPDYTVFYKEAKQKGYEPANALQEVLGVPTWDKWTNLGGDLNTALERLKKMPERGNEE